MVVFLFYTTPLKLKIIVIILYYLLVSQSGTYIIFIINNDTLNNSINRGNLKNNLYLFFFLLKFFNTQYLVWQGHPYQNNALPDSFLLLNEPMPLILDELYGLLKQFRSF